MKATHMIPLIVMAVINIGTLVLANIQTKYAEEAAQEVLRQEQIVIEIEKRAEAQEKIAQERAAEAIMAMNEAKRMEEMLKTCENR